MSNERFVRWQGQTIAQLSLALSLFSGLSIASLGFLFSLVKDPEFKPTGLVAALFLLAIFSFFISSVAGSAAVITRLIDFRLTAKKTREHAEEPLTYFGADASTLGKITWFLFWALISFFILGIVLSAFVLSKIYLVKILNAVCF